MGTITKRWTLEKMAEKPEEAAGLLVSADGLEPSTHALKGHCSAN
jgi:hypothetical protein